MSVNEILRNAEQVKYLGTATLNNTIKHPAVYHDQVCGNYAIGQITSDFKYESNANVKISNDRIKNTETTVQISGNVSTGVSMPEPYTTGLAKRSFGNIVLNNLDNRHDFKNRKFRGSKISIFVGGLVNKGTPTQDNMTGANFEPYIVGRFGKGNTNTQNIDLAIDADSGELEPVFPTGVYQTGNSAGQTKPYIFGVASTAPKSIEEGLWQFHDGIVDTTHEQDLPVIYWLAGDSYPSRGARYASGAKYTEDTFVGYEDPAKPTSSLTSYDSGDFDWSLVDDQNLTTEIVSGLDIDASITSGSAELSTDGGSSFKILSTSDNIASYKPIDFSWKAIEGDTSKATTTKTAPFEVNCTGDIIVSTAKDRWVKFKTVGASGGSPKTGTVTISSADGTMKSCRLVIWAVRSYAQSVSNFSVTADSIIPQFSESETGALKHVLTYNNLDESEISFDYTSDTDVLEFAVWFDEVEIYQDQTVDLEIKYSKMVQSQDLVFNADSGAVSVSGTSGAGSITDLTAGNFYDYVLEDEILIFKIRLLIGYGGGEFTFGDLDYDAASGTNSKYGVYTSEQKTLIIEPRPLSHYPSSPLSVKTGIAIAGSGNDFRRRFKMKARIIDTVEADNVEEVSVSLSALNNGATADRTYSYTIKIGNDWKYVDMTLEQPHNLDVGARLVEPTGFELFLQVMTGAGANADVPFKIEIEYIYCDYIIGSFTKWSGFDNRAELEEDKLLSRAGIRVRNVNQDETKNLNCYMVNSVFKHPFPPAFDYCIYDKNGYIKAPIEYEQIEGDFIGSDKDIDSIEALRTISKLATGKDYITSSIAGKRASFMLDVQKPWFQHIADISSVCDYVAYENLATEGVTIIQRYNYGDALTQPAIKDGFIDNGIASVKQTTRQFRYSIKYRIDYSNDNKTKSLRSNIGYVGDVEEKEIQSIFYNKVDNEYLSGTIARDSMYAEIFEVPLVGIGHDIEIGTAREFVHKDIPSRVPCEIISKKHNEAGNTDLTLKVYRP